MRRLYSATALLLLMLLFSPPLASGEDFTVVYTSWDPYTFTEEGRATGFEIDIARQTLLSMGLRPEFIKLPWKRCLLYMKEGTADAVVSLLYTPERATYVRFPETHISVSRTVFFTTRQSKVRYSGDLDSLRGLSIGTVLGFHYGETFDRAHFLIKDSGLDVSTLIKKVVNGHNDLGVENELVIRHAARRLRLLDRLRFLEPPLHENMLYVGFSRIKTTPEFVARFSSALKRFKETEEYQTILDRYGVVGQ